MSGIALGHVAGGNARRFTDDIVPRRPFGTRRPGSEFDQGAKPLSSRSMDRGVADMRRRIGGVAPASASPGRWSWAIGGIVVVGLSSLIWLDAHGVATMVAHHLSGLL